MIGDKLSFKNLRHGFLKSRISGFRRFIHAILSIFTRKKTSLEEKLWQKMTKSTSDEITKIHRTQKAEESKKLEERRKQKVRDIMREKEDQRHRSEERARADEEEAQQESLPPANEALAKELEKIKGVADKLPKLWWQFLENLSLENCYPPMKNEVAEILGEKPGELVLYLRKYSKSFKEKGIGYIILKRTGQQVYVNRTFLRRWGQLICDVYDAIDKYEFANKLRNEAGKKRMDFAHDLAAFLHGKGFKEKTVPQLAKEYATMAENATGKTPGQINVAQFIARLMKQVENSR